MRHRETGDRYTLDADPGIDGTLIVLRRADRSMSFSGTLTGGLAWTGEETGGACTFDLAFSGAADGPDAVRSGTVTGSVCGDPVDHAWSG